MWTYINTRESIVLPFKFHHQYDYAVLYRATLVWWTQRNIVFFSSPAGIVFFACLSHDISYKMNCPILSYEDGFTYKSTHFLTLSSSFTCKPLAHDSLPLPTGPRKVLVMHLRLFKMIKVLDMICSTVYWYLKSHSEYVHTSLSTLTLMWFYKPWDCLLPLSYSNLLCLKAPWTSVHPLYLHV